MAIKTATPTSQKHFIQAFTDYLNSVVEQAADRDNDTIRTFESYMKTRRENIGARPSYVPAELGLNIPDEAFYHPVVVELSYYIADLIIIDNVGFNFLVSYTIVVSKEFSLYLSIGHCFLQQGTSYRGRPTQPHHSHNAPVQYQFDGCNGVDRKFP